MYKHSVLPMTDWLVIFLIFSTNIVCPDPGGIHDRRQSAMQEKTYPGKGNSQEV